AHEIERARERDLALAQRIDAIVQLADLDLHGVRSLGDRVELELHAVAVDLGAGQGRLHVGPPVAPDPRAPQLVRVLHRLDPNSERCGRGVAAAGGSAGSTPGRTYLERARTRPP